MWDEVASDSHNCLGRSCPRYGQCFYYRARRRVQHAQVLVVNHALFFSDLALRSQGASILPDYQAVIFDEAHTMEAVAAEHLGIGLSSGQIEFALNKLYNDRANKGLFVHYQMTEAQEQVQACHYLSDELFGQLVQWHEQHPGNNGRVRAPGQFENLLSPALESLARTVAGVADEVEDPSDRQDLTSVQNRLLELSGELKRWMRQAIPEAVYWLQVSARRQRAPRVTLSAAPIDIGPLLREQLFDQVGSAVMTSATLAVGQPASFAFFRSRVGLTQAKDIRLGSPFDYQNQAQLVLVDGMPDPSTEREAFERRCAEMICRYVERTDGRAFVLFTSYSLMRQMASQLTTWLTQQNLALYSQSEGMPRSLMLQRFKDNPRAVLFGTDSFWQGVDVPG